MAEREPDFEMNDERRMAETPTKAELQRQMEEARESISETVAEIRETVSNQYEEVREKIETAKETFAEVLDWREQFSQNPVAWGAGAVSVGILIGLGLARTFDDTSRGRRRRNSEAADLAATLLERLSHIGDAVLPTISGSLKEMFGIDLADYLKPQAEERKLPARKRASKKRAATKKSKPETTRRRAKRPA